MSFSALEILTKYFGYKSFRPQQEQIVNEIVAGRDVLVLMPTGGGKSLCYQVPALVLRSCCVVVSPLISLMKDQVDALHSNGISAAYLNSTQTQAEQDAIFEACYRNEIALLYVSPEKLLANISIIAQMVKPGMFAIDEAHCISSWGHDFRPEYTQLSFLRQRFPEIPFVALTATADKVTRKDIVSQLKLRDPRIFISSFDRPNLSLDVRAGLKPAEKLAEIEYFIHKAHGLSGIIYCMSRNTCEELSRKLKDYGVNVDHYHAGMTNSERARVQDAFINDDLQVVCATVAFGMGIDKSNVRWVIHYNLPKNIESYYQEIGRAGRDGLHSKTILYYNYADLSLLNKFASESGQAELNEGKLARMQQYAEADICRRRILLNYFSETLEEDCGNCDVCRNPRKHFDGTVLVQKALSAVARTQQKEGLGMIIDVLRGSQRTEVIKAGYHLLKTHGAGAGIPPLDWHRYVLQMINQGLLEIAYDEQFALKITPQGRDVLLGDKKAMLTVLPPLKKSTASAPRQAVKEKAMQHEDLLFEELRILRRQLAQAENVPAYIIFSDATLQEMARFRPRNATDLLSTTGVGEHKLQKYGKKVLQVILDFNKKHGRKSS